MLSACGFVDSGGSQGQPPGTAGADRTVNEQTTVALQASGEGDIIAYSWRQTGGPRVTLNNASTARATFVAPSVDQRVTLLFTLTTTDEFGAESDDDVAITINVSPTASAGGNRRATRGTQVTLNGTGSSDVDGSITRFIWEQVTGPQATLSGADTAQPTFTVPQGQSGEVLTFRVAVTDNNGARSTDTVLVRIDLPPVANAGLNRTATVGQTITLNGNASSDPENRRLTFRWTQIQGVPVTLNGATTATPSFVAPSVTLPVQLVFRLIVTDDLGAADSDSVVVTINPFNDPPVAVGDGPFTVAEGGTLNVPPPGVLANDTDPDGDPLTALLAAGPAHAASFNLGPNGGFVYVHDGSEFVNDSFTYRARDGISSSNLATVFISITPVNNAPIANDDTATTSQDTPVTINVVANDTDPDPGGSVDPASVVLGPQPASGTVTNNGNGTVTYTPNPGFTGSASFTYRVSDRSGAISNPGTVTVEVTATSNQPPEANDDVGSIDSENLSTTINVVANDTDPDGDINPASVAIQSQPSFGTAQPNGDGTVTYTQTTLDLFGNPQNDSFTYTVADTAGNRSDAATVTITPSNSDDDSTAQSCWTAASTRTLTAKLPSVKSGREQAGAPVRFDLVTNGKKGTAVVTDPATGAFLYTPHTAQVRGSDTFTYKVENAQGKTRFGEVTVVLDPRIMPLGDSITAGVIDGASQLPVPERRVGYRKPLLDKLMAAGYPIDFVGSQSFGAGIPGFDDQSEVHTMASLAGGAPAKDAGYPATGIYAWLNQNPADFVLLHVGSEDLSAARVDHVEAILNEIDRWESDHAAEVRVLLARVIDRQPVDPRISAFNDQLQAMAEARINAPTHPDKITIVDQHAALSYPADMSDRLHPTAAGYNKMAKAWFEGIQSTCQAPPTTK
jgi:hypothetical protein